MLSAYVRQMRPFLVIREVGSDAIHHHHNEGAIIHIQPVGATDEFIGTIPNEGAVYVLAQVWLVESGHDVRFCVLTALSRPHGKANEKQGG